MRKTGHREHHGLCVCVCVCVCVLPELCAMNGLAEVGARFPFPHAGCQACRSSCVNVRMQTLALRYNIPHLSIHHALSQIMNGPRAEERPDEIPAGTCVLPPRPHTHTGLHTHTHTGTHSVILSHAFHGHMNTEAVLLYMRLCVRVYVYVLRWPCLPARQQLPSQQSGTTYTVHGGLCTPRE